MSKDTRERRETPISHLVDLSIAPKPSQSNICSFNNGESMSLLLAVPLIIFPTLCPGFDYPAVLSVYDPDLGGVNCDDDCSTVATGPVEDWMYGAAGACPAWFLGATIHFPDVGHSMKCVDTGPAIRSAWSPRDQECVVYFDAMWHLGRDGKKITGAPYWAFYWLENWEVQWN